MAERKPEQPDDFIEMVTNWLNQPSDPIVQLPPCADQRGRQSEEDKRRSIHEHLKGKTSFERVEAEYPYFVDVTAYCGSRTEWTDLAQEWLDFKSFLVTGDELWEFSDVRCFGGF